MTSDKKGCREEEKMQTGRKRTTERKKNITERKEKDNSR